MPPLGDYVNVFYRVWFLAATANGRDHLSLAYREFTVALVLWRLGHGVLRRTAKLLCPRDTVAARGIHSNPSHPWTVTWTVRLKRTWPWLPLRTRRSRPHTKPGSKSTTPAWSAVVSTDRVPCIYAAEWLRSQETLSSDRLQGACADVRHSTHTGHSTDRPSRARVAESCWSFNGITSSTCRKHLGA